MTLGARQGISGHRFGSLARAALASIAKASEVAWKLIARRFESFLRAGRVRKVRADTGLPDFSVPMNRSTATHGAPNNTKNGRRALKAL